jgi:hypothetical protein
MFDGRRKVLALLLVFAAVLVVVTGCKKSDDDVILPRKQPDVGGPHFYAFDIWGDCFNVQVNEAAGLYSYKKIVGPAPVGVGQGSMTLAPGFGAHAYYDDDDGTMFATVPGKVLAIGGDENAMVGVPVHSGAYVATDIAGMYNYLSWDYDTTWDELSTSYGTILINDDGTWEVFDEIDGTANPASAIDSGTWEDEGDGLVTVTSATFGKYGTLAIYPSANGNLLTMRYQYRMGGDTYVGSVVALEQNLGIGLNDLDGNYVAIDWEGMTFADLAVSGTGTTLDLAGYDTLTFDSPWTGMISGGANVYYIGTTDGLLVRVEQKPVVDDGIVIFLDKP